MLSFLFSVFGIAQRHQLATSSMRIKASKLNSEVELNLRNTVDLLRFERLHLKNRIEALPASAEDKNNTATPLDAIIIKLVDETEQLLKVVQENREKITNSSQFGSIREWDRVLPLLHGKVSTSKWHIQRCKGAMFQFHQLLDNAERELEVSESLNINIHAISKPND